MITKIRVRIPMGAAKILSVSTPGIDTYYSDEWKLSIALESYLAYELYRIEPGELFNGFFYDFHPTTEMSVEERNVLIGKLYRESVAFTSRFLDHMDEVYPNIWEKLHISDTMGQVTLKRLSSTNVKYLIFDFEINDSV